MYTIVDTTLREGEQAPGVSFSLDEKQRIVSRLYHAGIREIEVGLAAPAADGMAELISFCRSTAPNLRLMLWSRCLEEDIAHGGRLRPDLLALSLPVSDRLLAAKGGKTRTWAEMALARSLRRALDHGLRVAVGLEDATRADPGFLTDIICLADEGGAERIRLADTTGGSSPREMSELVRRADRVCRQAVIAVHTHNDFGMATANAVAAADSGARYLDATILGLGERSGCARLEELAAFLMAKGHNHFDLTCLLRLSAEIAALTSRTIEPDRPVLGEAIFTCETGLHLQALHRDAEAYDPFPPHWVGRRHQLRYGAKAGRRALAESTGDISVMTLSPADFAALRRLQPGTSLS